MSVDYRALLVKYIDHVRQCEGITFLDRINDVSGWGGSELIFTDDEVGALLEAERQSLHDALAPRQPPP